MKSAALALCWLHGSGRGGWPVRSSSAGGALSGPSAVDGLCACLARLAGAPTRKAASMEVESAGTGVTLDLTARIRLGSAYTVGRIDFTGRSRINYSTRARRKTAKADCFRSRPRSKRSSRNSSPFTRLSRKAGTICPLAFQRDGERIGYFRAMEGRLQGRRLPRRLGA